ncbi:MAG: hypothetical protein JO020_02020 [Chloroflexi bacterium]|nr:hypothetical protein [Chloroflexota bacterium]
MAARASVPVPPRQAQELRPQELLPQELLDLKPRLPKRSFLRLERQKTPRLWR